MVQVRKGREAARPFSGSVPRIPDATGASDALGAPGARDADTPSDIVCAMHAPLVTTIDDGPNRSASRPAGPTVIILFNERTGPSQVAEIISNRHSFIETETWETVDEQDRSAYLLVVTCETATADQLFELIGSRLPDYIQARRFPPSRMELVRRTGTRVA